MDKEWLDVPLNHYKSTFHFTVAATQTPGLHLLDLMPGGNASIRLRAAERQERGLALTSAAFNRGNTGGGARGMVSAGDSFGRVHVWHLTELVSTLP